MQDFKEYLDHLRKEVTSRESKTDKEVGFKLAVMLIHERYKLKDVVLNKFKRNLSEIDLKTIMTTNDLTNLKDE